MKRILLLLLLVCCSLPTPAQTKHNIYVGVAVTELGVSASYNRKLGKQLDWGGGINSYYSSQLNYGESRSAVFLELRPHWGEKRSLFFLFGDFGLAINKGHQPPLATMSPLGIHTALGMGFCSRYVKQKRMGPFLSIGAYGNTSNERFKYPQPPPRSRERTMMLGAFIISLGFKF